MELKDLLDIPVSEMTPDMLEEKMRLLRKLKVSDKSSKTSTAKPKAAKSNEEKRLEDLLGKLDPETKKKLMEKFK